MEGLVSQKMEGVTEGGSLVSGRWRLISGELGWDVGMNCKRTKTLCRPGDQETAGESDPKRIKSQISYYL